MYKLFLNNFWMINNCKGQIAGSGFAIMIIGLLTGVGLILDTGKLFETRMKVQTSIDGTLIACGEDFYRKSKSQTSAQVLSCLRDSFEINLLENGLKASDCKEGDPTSTSPLKNRYFYTPGVVGSANGYMEINCSMKHETVLLGLLPGVNISNITSGSNSTGQYSVGGNIPVAIVFTLDLSNSINDTDLRIILASAVESLAILPTNSYVAVNTFNLGYNGNWSDRDGSQHWIKNLISWGNSGEVWLQLKNQDARNEASQRIQTITNKYWSHASTNGQGGLYMARRLLSKLNDFQGSKGIIFLSDGLLNASSYPGARGYAPYGGSLCNDNDTSCLEQFYTNKYPRDGLPNNRTPVVEYGSLYPIKVTPAANETWYKRNLYTQYDEYENQNPGTKIQSWPINETYLPALDLSYYPSCRNQEKSGNAMAVREADIARLEGIEIFTFCRGCGSTTGSASVAMQRISTDKNLPQNWLAPIQWRFEDQETTNCPGYGDSTKNGDDVTVGYNGGTYYPFNYQRDIIEKNKIRFARTGSGSITQTQVTEIFKGMIWEIQKGNLSK
jgi:hypothetical protein